MNYGEFEKLCSKIASIDPALVSNETGTREYLVYSLLDFIGFNIKSQNLKPEQDSGSGRADVALAVNGKPAILVEIKKASLALTDIHREQLIGYLKNADDKYPVGILTNGYDYRFFFDKGKISMDERNLPALTDRIPFSGTYDVCRGEIRKRLEKDISLIRQMKGL